jgi:uncharacterized membrane protein YdcZ (DUF606 family)
MIFYILAVIFGALTCTGCLLYGLFVKETNECRLAACISFLAGLIIMISGIALCVFKK